MNAGVFALVKRLDGLSAVAKCYLVKSLCVSDEEIGSMSLDELTRSFGLTRQALIRARKELVQPVKNYSDGYLLERPVLPPTGRDPRGRPRKGFQVNPAFLDDLLDSGLTPIIPNAEICHFLLSLPVQRFRTIPEKLAAGQKVAKEKMGAKGKNRPSAVNLYFLALLWALADDMGAIWGRGIGEIARLAGMSRAQADNQLTKLEQLGYVRARVSGVTVTRIFGRATGSILLNPAHPGIRAVGATIPWTWQQIPLGGNLPQTLDSNRPMMYQEADSIVVMERQMEQERRRLASLIREKRRLGHPRSGIEQDLKVRRLRKRVDDLRDSIGDKKRRFECGEPDLINILSFVPKEVRETLPSVCAEWNLHWPFIRASSGLREYVVLIVCRYASKLLQHRPLLDPSAVMVVHGAILSELREELVVRVVERPFSNPGWWWVLASWFYRESYALARQVLHGRRKCLGLVLGQRFPPACRYLVFPRLHLGRLDILLDETSGQAAHAAAGA